MTGELVLQQLRERDIRLTANGDRLVAFGELQAAMRKAGELT